MGNSCASEVHSPHGKHEAVGSFPKVRVSAADYATGFSIEPTPVETDPHPPVNLQVPTQNLKSNRTRLHSEDTAISNCGAGTKPTLSNGLDAVSTFSRSQLCEEEHPAGTLISNLPRSFNGNPCLDDCEKRELPKLQKGLKSTPPVEVQKEPTPSILHPPSPKRELTFASPRTQKRARTLATTTGPDSNLQMQILFCRMDRDKDGLIRPEDLKTGLKTLNSKFTPEFLDSLDLPKIFPLYSTDRAQAWGLSEFLAFMKDFLRA